MNKPEKKELIKNPIDMTERLINSIDFSHNQACNVWEKFHEQEMQLLKEEYNTMEEAYQNEVSLNDDLPCKVDLRKIVFEAVNCDSDTLSLKDAWKIADAVHKRLGNK